MSTPPRSEENIRKAAEAYRASPNNKTHAARIAGMDRSTFVNHLKIAAERGMLLDTAPAMPGFRISQVTTLPDGKQSIQQKPEHGEEFKPLPGHIIKGESAYVDPDGRIIGKWVKTREDMAAQQAAMEAVVAAFKTELPRAEPVNCNIVGDADLLTQYTITDLHMGMLSWHEESGSDYDLKIAEQLVLDWFSAALKLSPDSSFAILAQLGDLLHFDSLTSVTPTHGHVLDADSRFAKIVRVVIRVMRQIVRMLLQKHDQVRIIMADANHDPASEIWLREMFASVYENEPRISVDRSASTYYAFQWGLTGLFYHHGHKRKLNDVDRVFASDFSEIFGQTKYRYGHVGHRHADEVLKTKLMKIEQHETLAARDAHAARGGWRSGRSAKSIWYSKRFGECGRTIITPEMVKRDD